MPFDGRWFYGDSLFIIDPWLWLTLGVGVWLARRRGGPGPARQALVIATVYIATMCLTAQLARGIVAEAWRAEHGSEPSSLMVGPLPITPFQREIIVDAGSYYVTGTFTWFSPRVTFDPAVTPERRSRPTRRTGTWRRLPSRGFLVWSRFPFWTFDRSARGHPGHRQRHALQGTWPTLRSDGHRALGRTALTRPDPCPRLYADSVRLRPQQGGWSAKCLCT